MVKRLIAAVALVVLAACGGSRETPPAASLPPLIPMPASYRPMDGAFRFVPKSAICVGAREFLEEANFLAGLLDGDYGIQMRPIIGRTPLPGDIVITGEENDSGEAYAMTVAPDRITLKGGPAGVFHAIQTLREMMPARGSGGSIAACAIGDRPRFSWRGMHLDVCRHFFPPAFVKKYIDLLALYKMNMFHWHLTDDQGWRIEIKAFPKLTSIGGWRSGTMIGKYDDQRYDSVRYGGFYTQAEIRDILRYAESRHVTVVPEIEMPGHALAALSSYPEYSCTGGPFEPARGWGVFDDVYCPKEETFAFLEKILDEVCDLFPGPYVHIGGDECPKTRWKACPHCQALIRSEQLKDENGLQSYFVRRIEKILNARGKRLIGWDEILDGGLAPNATVMSWRGTKGGIAAARMGHQAVMTPGDFCYFDHYQADPGTEPLAIGGFTNVEKVYSYDPAPDSLGPEVQRHIIGAQGNLWTEYITTPGHVEYMALPRMAALAEVVWTPRDRRAYAGFRDRLLRHFPLLDSLGVHYRPGI